MLSGRLFFYLKIKEKLTGMVTRWYSLSLVLLLVVIPYRLLSLFVIRCHSLYHSLSLVVIRCHSLYHSLSLDVPLVCVFINDLFWLGSCKKFHAKILIARHFMIIYSLKIVLDCSSLIYNCLSDSHLVIM